MNRTTKHLAYGLVWLLSFVLVFIATFSSLDSSDVGTNLFRSQVGSIVWVIGFAAIFYSWARLDTIEHGKPKRSALVFAALWLLLNFLAHVAYLFYTRGLRNGFVASLKFICFLLASVIVLTALGRLAGLVFG